MQPAAFTRYSPRFASPCAKAFPASRQRRTSQRRIMVADYALEKESPALSGASSDESRLLLLLAEVLTASAAGLADAADRRLLRRLVAASGHGHEGRDGLVEVLLGCLELVRLAPDR